MRRTTTHHAIAATLCAGVLVLGASACSRERAETDRQSAASTPAETAQPAVPADTTAGSETAAATTPETTPEADVTAEAPMDNATSTGATVPPPASEQTDMDTNRPPIGAEPPADEPPTDQTDTDEAQRPQQP